MKPASAGLVALLSAPSLDGTPPFVQADLYTITLSAGAVIRLTTADVDVRFGGLVYSSKGPCIDQEGTTATGHWKVGLDVDTWAVTVMPRPVDPLTGAAYPDLIGNQPWIAAARAGALDGALLQVDRAYWPAWPKPWASPLDAPFVLSAIFLGSVADVEPTRDKVRITANSQLELLTTQMPRNVYQSSCRHTLFDAGCQLVAANFAINGVALAGSTQGAINASLPVAPGSGTYALGRLVMLSGANQGFSRLVRTWNGATLGLIAPLPFAIAAGDGFTVYPGCDKTQGTCARFVNTPNYGGFPTIPAPETSI